MSTKAKTQTAVQLAPRVTVCESNPHTFLVELEKLIAAGYRIDFQEQATLFMGCHIVTLALPEAGAAT